MPPGSHVALIGLNLAPAAWNWVKQGPVAACVLFKRASSVAFPSSSACWSAARAIYGARSTSQVSEAADQPEFHTPAFSVSTLVPAGRVHPGRRNVGHA